MITFSDFLLSNDHPNSIILLEGKRKVLPEDERLLVALGEKSWDEIIKEGLI